MNLTPPPSKIQELQPSPTTAASAAAVIVNRAAPDRQINQRGGNCTPGRSCPNLDVPKLRVPPAAKANLPPQSRALPGAK